VETTVTASGTVAVAGETTPSANPSPGGESVSQFSSFAEEAKEKAEPLIEKVKEKAEPLVKKAEGSSGKDSTS
jgi:hypothetical protein